MLAHYVATDQATSGHHFTRTGGQFMDIRTVIEHGRRRRTSKTMGECNAHQQDPTVSHAHGCLSFGEPQARTVVAPRTPASVMSRRVVIEEL